YVRGEYAFPAYRMQQAIEECYAKGYLGENIFGSSFKHNLILHRGAGAYVCGEESAMLESLEGKKGQPRMKPPFPAVSGLYACPTVINNVETLSNVPWIIANGGEAYAAVGVKNSEKWQENSTGTKLIS